MKTLNVGVIGIGVIATTKHIPNLLKREDVRITMLCDLDTAKAEKAKEELGLSDAVVCADYKEVCTSPDIDVVHVCTANPSHYEITMLALNNGKHVYCEKPMALTYKEAKEMVDTAREKGLAVRVININQVKIQKEETMTDDLKIQKLREQTAQYAIEHITKKGMHTGYAWLRDSFNEYYDAIKTPGVKISAESDIAHREILAQKVAIDCIHKLSNEQLQQLDKVLKDIVSETKVSNGIHR